MTTCSYGIIGGDFERAGSASRNLKDVLQSVGIGPQPLRKIMVAAYEAEMNVVIHAYRGALTARLHHGQVQVEVTDEGPGIADISLAMKEGYSTASPEARALGFGAGLGLPNIQRHADVFCIESTVGSGTRLRFEVHFEPLRVSDPSLCSMRLIGEKCSRCLQCLQVCPTGALRLFRDNPHILPHLCIECTSCIDRCPSAALSVEDDEMPLSVSGPEPTLLLPPPLLFMLGSASGAHQVVESLHGLGYQKVVLTHPWEESHRAATLQYANSRPAGSPPVLTDLCPSVTRLLQTRFPSLLPDLTPYASPLEAAAQQHSGAQVAVLCPSQRSVLREAGLSSRTLASASALRRALGARIGCSSGAPPPSATSSLPPAELPAVLRVEGIRHVQQTLEQLEAGELNELRMVELYACDHGCFGSGMLKGANPAVSAHAWRHHPLLAVPAHAHRRSRPLAARSGIRLDPDMNRAVEKLAAIDALARSLPGRNCGQCGAPSCRAFAEDVVLDRVSKRACSFATWNKGELG